MALPLSELLLPLPAACSARDLLCRTGSGNSRRSRSSGEDCVGAMVDFVDGSPGSPEVAYHKEKSTFFQLASKHVAHASMGAAAVLDGAPVQEDHDDAALFIIDPQVDFHEGGTLGIDGATADSERIAKLIEKHPDSIDHIFVSLDTHHRIHIAHAAFWRNAAGESPAPFTEILHADVRARKWVPREKQLDKWALEYTASLEKGGRFKHVIWPYHCVLGTVGHAVTPVLMPALDEWSTRRQRAVTWVLKGQNNRTEMYSALKAEVPVKDDPATHINRTLVASLASHRQVLICGEAKSHCVNQTTRDLLSLWPKDRSSDIVVLTDATSPVAGFEEKGAQFIKDMTAAGLTMCTTTEWVPPPKIN